MSESLVFLLKIGRLCLSDFYLDNSHGFCRNSIYRSSFLSVVAFLYFVETLHSLIVKQFANGVVIPCIETDLPVNFYFSQLASL